MSKNIFFCSIIGLCVMMIFCSISFGEPESNKIGADLIATATQQMFFEDNRIYERFKIIINPKYADALQDKRICDQYINENDVAYCSGSISVEGQAIRFFLAVDTKNDVYSAAFIKKDMTAEIFTENTRKVPDAMNTWIANAWVTSKKIYEN